MKKNNVSHCPRWQWRKLLLTMKLLWVFIIMGLISANAAESYSQNTRIDLNIENATLKSILNAIEEKTEFYFFYKNNEIEDLTNLSVRVNHAPVSKILGDLLKDKGFEYEIYDRYILIQKRGANQSVKNEIRQQHGITGKVIDSSGSPLPGVTIVVKGTTNGTVTNADGEYFISNIPGEAILQFSFVGMKTQEIIVGNKTNISVTMEVDAIGIEEVVAVGYGTLRKSDLTGSVSSVKLENTPQSLFINQTPLDALRGEVAGVNIGVSTTAGGTPSMQIRGQNSIYGSNDPLIVLDGVIYMGNLNDINPNDIATYDILKDAVSSAVYGSRAANGVIVITTKKGKSEKPVITFNATTGLSTWSNKPDLMNGAEYLKVFSEKYLQTEPTTDNLTGTELENYNNGIETNWLDLISRKGFVQNYQLAVSGKTKRVNYYLSTSYDESKGVILGDDFNRISLLSKIELDVTDWLSIGFDANMSKRDYSGVAASIGDAFVLPPYTDPYRDDQGNLEKYPRENSYINPLWDVESGTRDNNDIQYSVLLRNYATINCPWIKGLSYRINFQNTFMRDDVSDFYHEGYYVNEGAEIERYSPSRIESLLGKANGTATNKKRKGYVIDNILSYKQTLGDHHIDAILVATRDKLDDYSLSVTGKDYSDNGNTLLGIHGIDRASEITADVNNTIKTNIGYLGRLNYSFKNKYYLSGSVRRDGSSVFGEKNKWGTFSAVGLGWRISEEDFFVKSDIIDNLKIKLSWGQNGNQGIGPYTTLSTVVSGSSADTPYEFSDTPGKIYYGLYQKRMGNAELGWETTESINMGFESVWLKNRVFLDMDIYFSKTTDQLFDRRIPSMTGFTSMKASMGQVNNRGIEITAKTVNIKNGNWRWQSSLYLWRNFNKLIHLYEEDLDGDGVEDDDITNNLFIGQSIGAFYGYVQDGIVQEDDIDYIEMTGSSPGDPKYKDIDGVVGISTNDRKILGYSKPAYKINLGNTVTFKRITLYALLTSTLGTKDYYLSRNVKAFSAATPSRMSSNGIRLPYWTSKNPTNKYPSVTYAPDEKYMALQSRNYLKLQRVSLSYNLGNHILNKIGISSAKVFLSAEELFVLTDWSGGDPEAGIGVGSSSFPVTSNYSVGINMSF
ncbi:TonB-dependent receptor [Maribellus maritimus]|uniref:TonB-dependent receptor n=1 Tax=Maribellus maritimus TaxID=2870838 RepID=UPI001EECAED7|nr:TonB-dependent receptor [Maribellus maritimus]MCG6191336.1 TonB-dependent receptor [Maribellus maritimus]